jgi:hypothetical protein
VIVMFEALQGRLDVPAVTCRSDDDGQAEDVHIYDRYGVQHKDGRERELRGIESQSLATLNRKRKTRRMTRTSGVCGYMVMCRSNMAIVSQAVLTHSSASPSTY